MEEAAGERRPCAHIRMNTLIDNYSSNSGCLQTVYGTRFQTHLPFSLSLVVHARACVRCLVLCVPARLCRGSWIDGRTVDPSVALCANAPTKNTCRSESGVFRRHKPTGSSVPSLLCASPKLTASMYASRRLRDIHYAFIDISIHPSIALSTHGSQERRKIKNKQAKQFG